MERGGIDFLAGRRAAALTTLDGEEGRTRLFERRELRWEDFQRKLTLIRITNYPRLLLTRRFFCFFFSLRLFSALAARVGSSSLNISLLIDCLSKIVICSGRRT